MILVDAANVVGSRPTGWWRDRAGAARSFVDDLRAAVAAGRLSSPVVVVLEGKARGGAESGTADGVTVVHADGSGDDALVDVVARATGRGNAKASDQSDESDRSDENVTLVTADRELRRRVEALGANVVGPKWLLERLGGQ